MCGEVKSPCPHPCSPWWRRSDPTITPRHASRPDIVVAFSLFSIQTRGAHNQSRRGFLGGHTEAVLSRTPSRSLRMALDALLASPPSRLRRLRPLTLLAALLLPLVAPRVRPAALNGRLTPTSASLVASGYGQILAHALGPSTRLAPARRPLRMALAVASSQRCVTDRCAVYSCRRAGIECWCRC